MLKRSYGIALFALGFGATVACGGGGGSSPVNPGTSTPVTAAPATATAAPATSTPTTSPTAVATSSTAPAITPGPVTASWAGINGYAATSPPNFTPTFGTPQPTGYVGEVGPRVVFTAIGQTVHFSISQTTPGGNTPSSLSVACNSVVGTLTTANAVNGPGSGSFDLTLAKTTGGDPLCFVQISGSLAFLGLYPGATEVFTVVGP